MRGRAEVKAFCQSWRIFANSCALASKRRGKYCCGRFLAHMCYLPGNRPSKFSSQPHFMLNLLHLPFLHPRPCIPSTPSRLLFRAQAPPPTLYHCFL